MTCTEWTDTRRAEAGSAAVELTILTPLLVALMLFAVVAGRIGLARNEVYAAASDAARAASIRDRPADAQRDATATARAALERRGVSCTRLIVDTDTSRLFPGGSVRVTVRCSVDLRDASSLGVPLSRTVSANATEVVDAHRSPS
ncbi:MAG TPA: TadE family protein [Acidimicrobiia bacterium]|nr:TadE family protein [Acidimicrobiia bacterium]